MGVWQQSSGNKKGFTIVELIVVIAVIAILATISIVGYGSWRSTTAQNTVKSDLNAVASAMSNYLTFNNTYPTTAATFSSIVTASKNVTLTPTSLSATSYCVDGVSSDSPSNPYYISSATKDQGATAGTCASVSAPTSAPGVPTGLAGTAFSTSVTLSWSPAATGGTAASYSAQCSSDAAFITNVGQATTTNTSVTVGGLVSSTTQYCRVQASNSVGNSAWTSTVTVNTSALQPPTGLALSSATISSITLSWNINPDAASYTLQCTTDSSFNTITLSPQSISSPTVTGQFTGLPFNTTYYCRINTIAANSATSAWSATLTTATSNAYGSLAAGTSIEGYWTTAPTGYFLEDGSAVSRTQYAALFALIGTTYGAGDGSTTFNLPDSRGRVTVNISSSDAEFNTIGEKYGAKTDTQTVAQLPPYVYIQNPHTHVSGFAGVNAGASYGVRDITGYPGASIAGNINGQNGQNTNYHAYTSPTVATNQSTGGGLAHNIIQPSIVKMYAIKYALPDSAASTLPAGSSIHGYWTAAPANYLLEDGSAVSRTTYATLFAAIGTTYGAGDGSTTFNLPDSRGRVSVNISPSDVEFNTMGEKYGQKTHTMTVAEMPSHTYIQNPHNHVEGFAGINSNASFGVASIGAGNINASQNGQSTANHPYFSTETATNQSIGGGAAENVIQPSIVQTSAIKYTAATTGTSPEVSVGTSVPVYVSSVPSGYLAEDGSAVSRSTYANLFAVIGTTYGAGDGSTTFNVPDSRGRVGVNLNPSDVEFNTMGEKYGEKTHLMTIAEMATNAPIQNAHSHIDGFAGVNSAGTYGTTTSGYGNIDGQSGVSGNYHAYTSTETATNQSGGGGQAFNVIQPSIVKLFVIKY